MRRCLIIIINFIRKSKMICKFKVSGHAGYDVEGSDIVCSAVTAVVYGAIGALGDLCGLKEYEDVEEGLESDYVAFEMPKCDSKNDSKCDYQRDFANVSASVSVEINDKAQIILETMYIGLKQIEFIYDEYVKINEREV